MTTKAKIRLDTKYTDRHCQGRLGHRRGLPLASVSARDPTSVPAPPRRRPPRDSEPSASVPRAAGPGSDSVPAQTDLGLATTGSPQCPSPTASRHPDSAGHWHRRMRYSRISSGCGARPTSATSAGLPAVLAGLACPPSSSRISMCNAPHCTPPDVLQRSVARVSDAWQWQRRARASVSSPASPRHPSNPPPGTLARRRVGVGADEGPHVLSQLRLDPVPRQRPRP